jgi:hypothetical protein
MYWKLFIQSNLSVYKIMPTFRKFTVQKTHKDIIYRGTCCKEVPINVSGSTKKIYLTVRRNHRRKFSVGS